MRKKLTPTFFLIVRKEKMTIVKKAPEAQMLREPLLCYLRNNFIFFFKRRTARSRI